jgi:hypothetical protein
MTSSVRVRFVREAVAAAILLALCAAPAAAQSGQAGRPYQGLFGAGAPPPPNGQTVDVTVTTYGEYGIDPNAVLVTPSDDLVQREGWFGGVRGGLTYRKRTQRTAFGWTAEGSGRYYRDDRAWTEPAYRTQLGFDVAYGRQNQSRFHVDGAYEFQPYYTIPLLQVQPNVAEGAPIGPTSRDDLLFRQDRNIFTGTLRLEQGMGRRGVWLVESQSRRATSPDPLFEATDYRVGGGLGLRAGRYATVRLGYTYQRGEYGYRPESPLTSHLVDLGVDYRRPLPGLRKTTMAISTGSGVYETETGRHFRVAGTFALQHQFDKGWFLQTEYRRDVQVVEGFLQPLLSDGVTASLGGFLGRRVDFYTSVGYSAGDVGFDGGDNYDVLQASVRLRVALSRRLALDVEGLAYSYDFPARDVAVTPIAAAYERQAVRVQLTVWLPFGR